MTYRYRNRHGAERLFEAGEDIPPGWVPGAEFAAWRASGFKTNPPDLNDDGVPGGSLPRRGRKPKGADQ